jgi:GGDEF domain-containing protein
MNKRRILVVSDDQRLRMELHGYFNEQGYDSSETNRDSGLLESIRQLMPHLVILQTDLSEELYNDPDYKTLESTARTSHIPVIFITSIYTQRDRIGTFFREDEYGEITQPYDIEEFRLRVKNALDRKERREEVDLITGLPGRRGLGTYLTNLFVWEQSSEPWAYLDLEFALNIVNFHTFETMDDPVNGKQLLRSIWHIIDNAIEDLGTLADFVSHTGNGRFIIITWAKNVEALIKHIKEKAASELRWDDRVVKKHSHDAFVIIDASIINVAEVRRTQ